jgi:hypothetical protein
MGERDRRRRWWASLMMSRGARGPSGEAYAAHRSHAKYRFNGFISIRNGV